MDESLMTAELDALRQRISEVLGAARGKRIRIRHLRAEQSAAATLFPVHELSITLEDGEQIRMFLKRLSAKQPDHPDKQCRDREVRVYEELLTEPGLPVPRCHGSRRDDTAGVYELFLEYVGGDILKYHDYEHWFTAARRLAHLHKHFASRAKDLAACPYLLRFDRTYLRAWADRALTVVSERSAESARQLEPIVRSYDRVAERIAAQPLTLVHNDLAPKNVIADASTVPARICLVDWEMAGVGCGVLDLAHLKYGMDPANDQTMCAAYSSELAGTGLLPSHPRELKSLLSACELHKNVFRLSRSRDWQIPIESVARWIGECRRLWDTI
jgi:aminoglycoside phosphotransferase (APT) family kinase protein